MDVEFIIEGNDIGMIAFVDTEISEETGAILDIGVIKEDKAELHSSSLIKFKEFIFNLEYLCGHNIIHHDFKYLQTVFPEIDSFLRIDTLYLYPLLFPAKISYALGKEEKLKEQESNNPLNDAKKSMSLFYMELAAFSALSVDIQDIFCSLLYRVKEFSDFFKYMDMKPSNDVLEDKIRDIFAGKLCTNIPLGNFIKESPVELAYLLAALMGESNSNISSLWVIKTYPRIEQVRKALRGNPCSQGCLYCEELFHLKKQLKRIFGYDTFRTYAGESLQEKAIESAVQGDSLIAIFPTGGGKSITFQLPALIASKTTNGLTVVISPLQSLMKDQVDNLNMKGIEEAVTVNGLLSPIERGIAFNQVREGAAGILYISPEQLRSKTVEYLLMNRTIDRFVIDEAHCFSSWGQDFRVDYLYIGDFIKTLQSRKGWNVKIPVSCFTATAKRKVISDIRDYFKEKLDLDLKIYATSATRENLRYAVLRKETEESKYVTMRSLIQQRNCPTIVYVSRVKKTYEIAEKLNRDGVLARPYNGRMDSREKILCQEEFLSNRVLVIIATSAFGMGVDKSDVKLVIHYDISSSLEEYVQEAGRAGRDPSLEAECYVLFNESDLDQHFILLNNTKLSMSEIQQIWKAIKELTKQRTSFSLSPLEIARQAGWDDSASRVEMRVKTAIGALESAGYIKREHNVSKVYATGILARGMQEAILLLEHSDLFSETQKRNARMILSLLLSNRSIAKSNREDSQSRVDYLADIIGLEKRDVIETVNLMREVGLLEDSKDISVYVFGTKRQAALRFNRFSKLEEYLLKKIAEGENTFNLKELNEGAMEQDLNFSNIKSIKIILHYWVIKNYIQKQDDNLHSRTYINPLFSESELYQKYHLRMDICAFIIEELYEKYIGVSSDENEKISVRFSILELCHAYQNVQLKKEKQQAASFLDIEDALLYLSKIGAMNLEGGFLVLYNSMHIKRIEKDNRIQYKVKDYSTLRDFYKQKMLQIHIVGEYANMMVRSYAEALQFVKDYFQMDFKGFISKYFKEERLKEIERNISPKKYMQLFGELSETQEEIIRDDKSQYIVVTAGPGSGKTRVLVHKLASLLLMEDIKHEQLLMLTFSRAATVEFKKRLKDLIGDAANFIEIKTFHSYCFDLLGQIGSVEKSRNVVQDATDKIQNGEVEISRVTKAVIVIDEAQDMDKSEFELICTLMQKNEALRIVAVGDDDQNIYEFRGSDSKYLKQFITKYGAKKYELLKNYRSKNNIVKFANQFAKRISERMKTKEAYSYTEENGIVKLYKYTSENFIEGVVENVAQTYCGGSTCILTDTNEQASQIVRILLKKGIRAKLIQSNEEFKLYNLLEIRFFLSKIKGKENRTVISDKVWKEATKKLSEKFFQSDCLENCLNLISEFDECNPTKYITDFCEFVKESKYEDFYTQKNNFLFVSTLHKSKGREFDKVCMVLNKERYIRDEEVRTVFVGLTRAKNELYIHHNNCIFDGIEENNIDNIIDTKQYPPIEETMLSLGYKDIVLSFSKNRKTQIFMLRSGMELCFENGYMYVVREKQRHMVSKMSKFGMDKLENMKLKGYIPYKAKIRFIVVWKEKDSEEEIPVILPDVYLKKHPLVK